MTKEGKNFPQLEVTLRPEPPDDRKYFLPGLMEKHSSAGNPSTRFKEGCGLRRYRERLEHFRSSVSVTPAQAGVPFGFF